MGKQFRYISNKPREKIRLFSEEPPMLYGSRIEILSNREMLLEGCCGVEAYTDTYVKLRLPHGTVLVCGKNFDLSGFHEKAITVSGEISSLEFCI